MNTFICRKGRITDRPTISAWQHAFQMMALRLQLSENIVNQQRHYATVIHAFRIHCTACSNSITKFFVLWSRVLKPPEPPNCGRSRPVHVVIGFFANTPKWSLSLDQNLLGKPRHSQAKQPWMGMHPLWPSPGSDEWRPSSAWRQWDTTAVNRLAWVSVLCRQSVTHDRPAGTVRYHGTKTLSFFSAA